MTSNHRPSLDLALKAVAAASEHLRHKFHCPDGPPADAEQTAETILRQHLTSDSPWSYQVQFADGNAQAVAGQDPELCWWVCPCDVPTAYRAGQRGAALSVALVRGSTPIVSVVCAFNHPDDEGDLFAWAEGCGPLLHNGQPVSATLASAQLAPGAVVLLAPDADQHPSGYLMLLRPARYLTLPSPTHRLACVAAGAGVAAVGPASLPEPCLLAARGLLNAVGGTIQHFGTSLVGGGPEAVAELIARESPIGAEVRSEPPFCLVQPQAGRAVRDVGQLRRAQGCLIGQLAGDSLGGLVEFCRRAEIQRRFPDGVREMLDGGTWDNLAGQVTDDSEMALVLARTLIHHRRYEPELAMEAYTHWWPEAWDRGSTLGCALGPACRGKTIQEKLALAAANANHSSQSNGSLMRCSPLGIFGARDPEEAAACARRDSQLTHPNPHCIHSCGIFIRAVAHAVWHGGDPRTIYQVALEEARRPGIEPAVLAVVERAQLEAPADYVTSMGWVLIALQNAFYQLLHAPTVEEGIVDTIRRGGDTDTTAAIAGALLGAVHGRGAIPERWLRGLQTCRPVAGMPTRHYRPVEYWPVDVLELAEALLAASGGG